ncbi:interleukin-17C [Toxotes jaculatrix]|uniref:interleukin-17C n=1 Tax=Toxotes jaculatrix TaxID=941984 RepID=UPI001B3A99CA|nr:interleukin-17C [Toxotes jaculatrix]
MDMKQVIVFALLLVPVCMNRCFDEEELAATAHRRLGIQSTSTPLPPSAAADSPASCPVALYANRALQNISDRALSPWRYVTKTKKDYFPSTYSEAECLCTGCILIQGNNIPELSHDYNSFLIKQNKFFLKRELCGDKQKYQLKPVYLPVAVGCTCVRPKTYH